MLNFEFNYFELEEYLPSIVDVDAARETPSISPSMGSEAGGEADFPAAEVVPTAVLILNFEF